MTTPITAITGAAGFIGGALARHLVQRGHPVRALMRGGQPVVEGTTAVVGDLASEAALAELCRGAQVVVHCAAFMGKRDQARSDETNLVGTDRLLAAAAAAGVKRFVFISSISVYRASQHPDRTFTEAQAPQADPRLNLYSRSKLEGERRVAAASVAAGMEFVIVRPTNVYGPGCRPWGVEVERFVRNFHFCFGQIKFNFIHIDDVVEAIALTCTHAAAAQRTFNIGAEHLTLADFQRHVAATHDVWTVTLPRPLDRLVCSAIDGVNALRGEVRTTSYTVPSRYPNLEARRVLGFQPRHFILGDPTAVEHLEPAALAPLVDAVTDDRTDARWWVHPVGSGTSKSDCYKTSGRSIGVGRFDHLERLEGSRVRVGAGVKLANLLAFLRQEGLALPTIGEWGGQTIAGALSTGTHGGAYAHGTVCSSVSALTLVDGRGRTRRFTSDEPDFAHVLPSFGLLGVITEVELRCEPAFSLVMERRCHSLAGYLEDLAQNPDQWEFRSSIWLPALDCVVDYGARRAEAAEGAEPLAGTGREKRFNAKAMVVDWVSRQARARRQTPDLAPASAHLFPPRTYRGHYDQMLAPLRGDAEEILMRRRRNRTPPEAEYALPMSAGIELVQALDAWMQRTRSYPDRPIGLRPGGADRGTLSATHGALSLWVSLFVYPHTPLMAALPELLTRFGARPHWGKCLIGPTEHLHTLYPGWDDFCRLRAELDPDGRFLNAFSARLGIGTPAGT